jgi:dihydroorotate dehydrogenase electron transfer subunit
MKNEQPLMLSIQKVIAESVNTKTLVFQHKLNSKPGQFVMVWIPRLDEKPYSVAYQDNNKFAITVTEYGPFSAKLNELKIGDRIGIRGLTVMDSVRKGILLSWLEAAADARH